MITLNDAPLYAHSSLQAIAAVSTMEVEILALAHAYQKLFPIFDLVEFLKSVVGLPTEPTSMQVSIYEDNSGALVLANMLPPQFTPQSKTYHVKTIWFQEEIKCQGTELVKIDTIEKPGDLFTKSLSAQAFVYLRKKLLGW